MSYASSRILPGRPGYDCARAVAGRTVCSKNGPAVVQNKVCLSATNVSVSSITTPGVRLLLRLAGPNGEEDEYDSR